MSSEVVNVHAAKTSLSRLIERAEAGEEIVIGRAGKPVAKLVPYRPVRKAILAADVVHVSAASVWEIAIKRAKGRFSVPDDLMDRVDQAGFEALSVTPEHGWLAGSLPRLHDDPFDRVIVAQAIAEGLTIVTSDHRMRDYGVPVLAA